MSGQPIANAEVLKNNLSGEDDTENKEANTIVNGNHPHHQHQHYHATDLSEDRSTENFEATLRKRDDSPKEGEEERKSRKSRGQVARVSKAAAFLQIAVDVALAGLLVGWIYRKPTMNKMHLGVGALGLSAIYGFQWLTYNRMTRG